MHICTDNFLTHARLYDDFTGASSSPGTALLTAQATDADTQFFRTIRYSLVGDETALRFFQINPTSGVVSLRSDITAEQDSVYR